LVTLLPKESVFWEPLATGPPEVRVRRVAGIVTRFLVIVLEVCEGLGGCDVE
jgi:hypothetical protein